MTVHTYTHTQTYIHVLFLRPDLNFCIVAAGSLHRIFRALREATCIALQKIRTTCRAVRFTSCVCFSLQLPRLSWRSFAINGLKLICFCQKKIRFLVVLAFLALQVPTTGTNSRRFLFFVASWTVNEELMKDVIWTQNFVVRCSAVYKMQSSSGCSAVLK